MIIKAEKLVQLCARYKTRFQDMLDSGSPNVRAHECRSYLAIYTDGEEYATNLAKQRGDQELTEARLQDDGKDALLRELVVGWYSGDDASFYEDNPEILDAH